MNYDEGTRLFFIAGLVLSDLHGCLPLACYNGRTLTDERSARYKQHPEKKIPSGLEWKVLFQRELIAVQDFFFAP